MNADDRVAWLLSSAEPWTRYRTLLDIVGSDPAEPEVANARDEMVEHPMVLGLIERSSGWPGYALKRHNDAGHPLYAISTLADFGLQREDLEIAEIAGAVMARFDGKGFETLLWLPRFLTKEEDAEAWSWMLCDSPTLLYSLLAFGYGDQPVVQQAVAALLDRVEENGWRCGAADTLPSFGGPGRKGDTCPIATIYTLKALSQIPELRQSGEAGAGIEAILTHWEHQEDYKLRMFGIGTEFRKLKYPFVWYDILHVADVLSRYPQARQDERLSEIVGQIESMAGADGRYTAGSMYRAWSEWSFSDKRRPSPFLTMLAKRIQLRMAA